MIAACKIIHILLVLHTNNAWYCSWNMPGDGKTHDFCLNIETAHSTSPIYTTHTISGNSNLLGWMILKYFSNQQIWKFYWGFFSNSFCFIFLMSTFFSAWYCTHLRSSTRFGANCSPRNWRRPRRGRDVRGLRDLRRNRQEKTISPWNLQPSETRIQCA